MRRVVINDSWSVDYLKGIVYRTKTGHPTPFSYTGDGIKWKYDEVPTYVRNRVERDAKDMF